MNNTYLCIGGPLDGKRRHCERERFAYAAVEPLTLSALASLDKEPTCTAHFYRAEVIGFERTPYRVFLHEDLTPQGAFKMLIEGYRSPSKELVKP